MNDVRFGVAGATVVYVVILLIIAVFARHARRERTLSDFFLAGRSIGVVVLLFTLFATQYSGNSMSAFPGQTYREGLAYFMTVPFMVGMTTGYLLFAPTLFSLSRTRRYLTPTDFIADRFQSPTLSYLSAGIFALTLLNFLLAQLMALGHAFEGITGGAFPYAVVVAGGGLAILVYELMGGMRAVAWTDVLQGAMIAIGLSVVIVLLVATVGTPGEVVAHVRAMEPQKIESPSLERNFVWLSNFFLLGLGGPLYPQAIQRVYAAKSLSRLRHALAAMTALPWIATTSVVFIGVVGIMLFPGLSQIESDQITFRVLAELVQREPLAMYPTLLVMMGVVAAIMSTADSCLLSLSSILTKDFVARLRGLSDDQAEQLIRFAPIFSIATMVVLVSVALTPRITLWGLLVVKFEILIQLSPTFVLGTAHERGNPRGFRAGDMLWGIGAGLGTVAALYAAGVPNPGGWHAGTVGVFVNYAVALMVRAQRLTRAT